MRRPRRRRPRTMIANRSNAQPPASLRRVFWLTFLPLAFVLLGSFALILLQASRVGDDIKYIYQEIREFGLARRLQDEISGLQKWVAADITDASADIVFQDARQHFDTCNGVIEDFLDEPEIPSSAEHEGHERDLLLQIQDRLARLRPYVDRKGRVAEPD